MNMEEEDRFSIYKTSLGLIRINYIEGYITGVSFIRGTEPINIVKGESSIISDKCISQLEEYFLGKRKKFDIPIILRGTEFQKKVWSSLCNISYGETRSYKEIAEDIGNPKASRAIGMANNRNPIPIIVPCHRVIGTNGELIGYSGGIDIKNKLLELEYINK